MNESELEGFEKELRKLKAARPPEEFMARLASLKPAAAARLEELSRPSRHMKAGWWLLRWLAPVAAVLAVVAYSERLSQPPGKRSQPALVSTLGAADTDGIELERRLISEYDAVAEMPGGEPVRFRCREWTDQVVLRDSANGFVLERSLPRYEIVPVRLETY